MPISVFDTIYKENLWKSQESRSGRGAELCNTESVRANLRNALEYIGASTILDASCGDFNWMKEIDLGDIQYMGCDIVQELIDQNIAKYTNEKRKFFQADITRDKLPHVDLILCRCTLYHLSFRNIRRAINNLKRSGDFLLLTNMPRVTENIDIEDGNYRKLNLEIDPICLPAPITFFMDAPSTNEILALYRSKDIA